MWDLQEVMCSFPCFMSSLHLSILPIALWWPPLWLIPSIAVRLWATSIISVCLWLVSFWRKRNVGHPLSFPFQAKLLEKKKKNSSYFLFLSMHCLPSFLISLKSSCISLIPPVFNVEGELLILFSKYTPT